MRTGKSHNIGAPLFRQFPPRNEDGCGSFFPPAVFLPDGLSTLPGSCLSGPASLQTPPRDSPFLSPEWPDSSLQQKPRPQAAVLPGRGSSVRSLDPDRLASNFRGPSPSPP